MDCENDYDASALTWDYWKPSPDEIVHDSNSNRQILKWRTFVNFTNRMVYGFYRILSDGAFVINMTVIEWELIYCASSSLYQSGIISKIILDGFIEKYMCSICLIILTKIIRWYDYIDHDSQVAREWKYCARTAQNNYLFYIVYIAMQLSDRSVQYIDDLIPNIDYPKRGCLRIADGANFLLNSQPAYLSTRHQ